jgi:hypothetical protein
MRFDTLGGFPLDDGGADHARRLGFQLDVEPLFDDVHDLVDRQAHGRPVLGKHQHGLNAILARLPFRLHVDERHQGTTILHDVLAVAVLDRSDLEQGQQLVPQAKDRRLVDQLDLVTVGLAGADQLVTLY